MGVNEGVLAQLLQAQKHGAVKSGIKEFWKTLTPEKCTRYINHLHRVIPVVIEKQGNPSGF